MRAIILKGHGDAGVMHLEDRPIPEIGDDEVLIKVKAAGINRTDIAQRKGHYPPPKGVVEDILGLEVAGKIEKTGKNVSDWQKEDYVCALVPGGGYAGYVKVHAGSCLPVPKGFSLEDAAALPEALFTVWHNVFQRGGLKKGEQLLVYGGSGGIGTMTIQLATILGAEVTTLAGSDEKAAYCYSLGAARVIAYQEKDPSEIIPANSIDVILDSIGAKYAEQNLEILKPEGRLVYINGMEGMKPQFDISKIMRKRLHITGSTMRSRSPEFKQALAGEIIKKAYPLLESGKFQKTVRYIFPLEKAAEAHQLMESRAFMGKIILML